MKRLKNSELILNSKKSGISFEKLQNHSIATRNEEMSSHFLTYRYLCQRF